MRVRLNAQLGPRDKLGYEESEFVLSSFHLNDHYHRRKNFRISNAAIAKANLIAFQANIQYEYLSSSDRNRWYTGNYRLTSVAYTMQEL